MNFTYKTIENYSKGIFTDKGSKFIGYIFPVTTEDEFKIQLKKIKSEHTGARHFCYAYRMGLQEITDRSSDDGEPSGTAGKPILNQMLSANLTQCAIIVVRYFGGTLLGTSGLINAYKSAAKLSIENNTVIEKPITTSLTIKVSYEKYNELMLALKKNNVYYETLRSSDDYSTFKIQIPKNIETDFKIALYPLIIT